MAKRTMPNVGDMRLALIEPIMNLEVVFRRATKQFR
jgi:hypothetical protein